MRIVAAVLVIFAFASAGAFARTKHEAQKRGAKKQSAKNKSAKKSGGKKKAKVVPQPRPELKPEPKLEPAVISKMISDLPPAMTALELVDGRMVLRKGKCCHDPQRFAIEKPIGRVDVSLSLGFETIEGQIVDVQVKKDGYVLSVFDSMMEATGTVVIRKTGTPGMYVIEASGYPMFPALKPATFVDDPIKREVPVVVEDDCPADGEAC